ncbi:MAG: tetratricopeptide repeat protein [Nitrospirae bacterium]|nr:tetratricopeptide repeat protein [Nitrospirota bacterium]
MRAIAVVLFLLLSLSVCFAAEENLQKAYSLYAKGDMKEAINILEEYVKQNPDPNALYFLGYAYYKIKKMDMAMKYFNEVYLLDPDFSPAVVKKELEPEKQQ